MSLAAQEACLLDLCLKDSAQDVNSVHVAQRRFLSSIASVIEGPWSMSAVGDFAHAATRGKRPDDLDGMLRMRMAVEKAVIKDAGVHTLMMEVMHLVKPLGAYQEPGIQERITEAA